VNRMTDAGFKLTGMSRQGGMTIIAVVMILVAVAFLALIIMRILPIYINYFSIRSTLEGLKQEPEIERMSPVDVYRSIERRFDISYVRIINARQIKVRQQGRDKILELVYEDRRPLVGNLDVVAKFNDTIVLSPQ
jgi:hypothetical protein